jgi:hypothetical protein
VVFNRTVATLCDSLTLAFNHHGLHSFLERYRSRYEPCSNILSLWYVKYPRADLQHLTIVSDNQRKAMHNKDGNLASKGRASHITLLLFPVHLLPWDFMVTFISRIKLNVALT